MAERAPGFADDPQRRIDFAYRANHLTALAAKALIRAYYGQAPRYAYFSGCSDGGREALKEAQRYPDDFDGISAGAPAMLFQVQNSFWHAWTTAANLRADGSRILSGAKLAVLHATVIAHCDAQDGAADDRLVMYHGWPDTSIAPLISIAYYQAMQRVMGAARPSASRDCSWCRA